MNKIVVFLSAVFFFAAFVANAGDFVNPAVPDFLGTVIVEIDHKPTAVGSGFLIAAESGMEFITAYHVIEMDDEDIIASSLKIFTKNMVVSIPRLSARKNPESDLAHIPISGKKGATAAHITTPQVGETLTIFGTGQTEASKFRGIAQSYYGHKPVWELWQYGVPVRVVATNVAGCEIIIDLCKDQLRSIFHSGVQEFRYTKVKSLTQEMPHGFSGGPAVNQNGEVVGIYIGGFTYTNTDILVPVSRGGQ